MTGAQRVAAEGNGKCRAPQTDRHGRVNAFTPHSDVLLCHPSSESITVSSRLAARHKERQARREAQQEDERIENSGTEMKQRRSNRKKMRKLWSKLV